MGAIGFSQGTLAGARTAGMDGISGIRYIPMHYQNGILNSQRCTIPVYVNGKKRRDGNPGRRDILKCIAWGMLADVCAKGLSQGKEFTSPFVLQSYDGRVYDNGTMVMNQAGQPLVITKTSLVLNDIVFGPDSVKVIDLEIQTGKRPQNWNIPGHPDAQLWATALANRNAARYIPGSKMFEFATVLIPNGANIVLVQDQYAENIPRNLGGNNYQAYTGNQGNNTAPNEPNTPAAPAPAMSPAAIAALVQQVLTAQTQGNAAQTNTAQTNAAQTNTAAPGEKVMY